MGPNAEVVSSILLSKQDFYSGARNEKREYVSSK